MKNIFSLMLLLCGMVQVYAQLLFEAYLNSKNFYYAFIQVGKASYFDETHGLARPSLQLSDINEPWQAILFSDLVDHEMNVRVCQPFALGFTHFSTLPTGIDLQDATPPKIRFHMLNIRLFIDLSKWF